MAALSIPVCFRRMGMVLVLLSALGQGLGAATQKTSLFEEANRFYEKGNYPEAIRRYENLLDRGVSPEVLFNLGNARFRNGDVGLAILHYHQARRLAPRDGDVFANLRFARQTVPGTVSIQPGVFSRAARYFSLDEIAIVMTIIFWGWLGLLALGRLKPGWRPSLRSITIVAGLFWLLAAFWLAGMVSIHKRQVAIVTVEQAQVRLGPLRESQPAYTANDGAELRVLSTRPEWVQVQDQAGRSGWVQDQDVALFP